MWFKNAGLCPGCQAASLGVELYQQYRPTTNTPVSFFVLAFSCFFNILKINKGEQDLNLQRASIVCGHSRLQPYGDFQFSISPMFAILVCLITPNLPCLFVIPITAYFHRCVCQFRHLPTYSFHFIFEKP